MSSSELPEIADFERRLSKSVGDAAGLGNFFGKDKIVVTRAPARLDVMGGIADYSGANVCETTLGVGTLAALQPRTDGTLRILTRSTGPHSLPVETCLPLDFFQAGTELISYRQLRELCHANPLASWAAYVIGSVFTLIKEERVHRSGGFNLALLSSVPMNVGVGSSAATEIAVLAAVNAQLGLNLSGERLAQLGQMAENQVVGAPCGIMDQIAVALGRRATLTHILCRPGAVVGDVEIPAGTGFVGINSMVRHSVAGNPYTNTRIGAFMGKKIINELRARQGGPALNHLTELTPAEFVRDYASTLPDAISGADFVARYGHHEDTVTTIKPDIVYRVAGPTSHPVQENDRVLRFMQALRAAGDGDESALIAAGELMYSAHDSYRDNCHLSVSEVDSLVEAVRNIGAAHGLYGAKITGGGTGGTVAVFGKLEALREHIPVIARDYSRRIGRMPDIFEGTSPGALEFGARRYQFGAAGWQRIPA